MQVNTDVFSESRLVLEQRFAASIFQLTLILLAFPLGVSAQQVSDTLYHFENVDPAYAAGEGPVVCFDEAHFNYHTLGGRYLAFGELLASDGFTTVAYDEEFSFTGLASCDIVVIANALAQENQNDWQIPHNSAFSGSEIEVLVNWIRDGGHLLLFADHSPFSGAAADLGAALGVNMLDVYALSPNSIFDVYTFPDETLHGHPILQGRNKREAVDTVTTFTGHVYETTTDWQPIATVGSNMRAYIPLGFTFQEGTIRESPSFSVAGWKQIAAREWDSGRIVISGEAAMCTAQTYGEKRLPMGMNHPSAPRNAQFCLNIVRWLTGIIDP